MEDGHGLQISAPRSYSLSYQTDLSWSSLQGTLLLLVLLSEGSIPVRGQLIFLSLILSLPSSSGCLLFSFSFLLSLRLVPLFCFVIFFIYCLLFVFLIEYMPCWSSQHKHALAATCWSISRREAPARRLRLRTSRALTCIGLIGHFEFVGCYSRLRWFMIAPSDRTAWAWFPLVSRHNVNGAFMNKFFGETWSSFFLLQLLSALLWSSAPRCQPSSSAVCVLLWEQFSSSLLLLLFCWYARLVQKSTTGTRRGIFVLHSLNFRKDDSLCVSSVRIS